MDKVKGWQTEEMELGEYKVAFTLTNEDFSNFYEGEMITIGWTATDGNGRFGEGTIQRRIRYSNQYGKYFNWKGYAISYEDFNDPIVE